MKTPFALISFSLCLALTGCSKDAAANQESTGQAAGAAEEGDGCGGCIDEQMLGATNLDPDKLGKGITLEEFTPISAIIADYAKFEGERVKVKGEAVGVCAKMGCWMTLKSEKDNDKALRVKVKDGEIVFPVTLKGHEVIAEGVVEKQLIPVEVLREAYARQAEQKGEEFDPESVTEPRVVWQLKGLGAKCPEASWQS